MVTNNDITQIIDPIGTLPQLLQHLQKGYAQVTATTSHVPAIKSEVSITMSNVPATMSHVLAVMSKLNAASPKRATHRLLQ